MYDMNGHVSVPVTIHVDSYVTIRVTVRVRVSIATTIPGISMLLNKSYQVAQVFLYEILYFQESIENTKIY